jgi:geranylgeranyl pyrophosphate synthase
MDVYDQIVDVFSTMPHVATWKETQTMFQHAASGKPEHWLLPVLACEAVGGATEQAVPAMVAVGCAHIGILLVDDMLDADPRGEYNHLGMPAAANLACAFQAAALDAVALSTNDPLTRLAILTSFNEMFLSTAFGQFLDVQVPADEAAYWRTTRAKSSPFFGAALQVGVLAGGGTLETAEKLKALGCLYGEMIQIHDDMHDSMEVPANPDWIQRRLPLPILFASLVKHPEQIRFLELNQHIAEPGALQEAQEIIIRCGAISYCIDQVLQRHKAAGVILESLPCTCRTVIAALLDEVIAPVRKLLEACKV